MVGAENRRSSPRIPAMPSWEAAGWVMAAFAFEYASDPRFGYALETLVSGHEQTARQVDISRSYDYLYPGLSAHLPDSHRAFAHDLAAFSERWGLDRLPDYQGTNAVLDWCSLRSRNRRVRADWFISGFGAGGGMPSIGEVVKCEMFQIAGPNGETIWVRDEERKPLIRVNLTDEWPIYNETREAAKKRLLARCAETIDAELSRIRREADTMRDATGQPLITFPTTKPQRSAHLNWLYQRMAYRRPCRVIAKNEYVDEPTVRNPTDSIKSELGIAEIPVADEHYSPI